MNLLKYKIRVDFTKPNYLKISLSLLIIYNFSRFLNNYSKINFYFTDDIWILLGEKYSNIFEKIYCCSVSHPFASLIFQSFFSMFKNSGYFILFLFIVGQIFPLILFRLKNLPLTEFQKFVTVSLLLLSPMYSNYSLRPKTYIYEAVFSLVLINIFYKIKSHKKITAYDFIFVSFMVLFSATLLIPISALIILIIKDRIYHKSIFIISKVGLLLFVIANTISLFLTTSFTNQQLNLFWDNKFFPLEGGLSLASRWTYLSFLGIINKSNDTNLGFTNITFQLVFLFIFLGVIYSFKNQKIEIVQTLFLMLSINYLLAIFRIFPFGGTRTSIYLYGFLAIIVTFGIQAILDYSESKNLKNLFVIFVLVSLLLSDIPEYKNTTKNLNDEKVVEAINFIKNTNEKVMIHHSSHWFVSMYYPAPIKMERISFNDFLNRKGGTGTFARPVPLIQDEKFIQLCFDYPTSRKKECNEIMKNYLLNNQIKSFYLAGFYTNDDDVIPYSSLFEELNFNSQYIIDSDSNDLIFYYK